MTVEVRQGSHPHIGWMDLQQNGVFVECAIMKRDRLGNIFYFPIKWLDEIDKRRLFNIITNRNARSFELWDLMSQITLNNGCNALVYFHQLVRMMTPSGQILNPAVGQTGSRDWDTRNASPDQQFSPGEIADAAAKAAGEAAAQAAMAAYTQTSFPQPQASTNQATEAAETKTTRKTTKKKTSKKSS